MLLQISNALAFDNGTVIRAERTAQISEPKTMYGIIAELEKPAGTADRGIFWIGSPEESATFIFEPGYNDPAIYIHKAIKIGIAADEIDLFSSIQHAIDDFFPRLLVLDGRPFFCGRISRQENPEPVALCDMRGELTTLDTAAQTDSACANVKQWQFWGSDDEPILNLL